MDSKTEQELNKIKESLKEILQIDEIPPFEVNDETVPILLQIIANHHVKKQQNAVLCQQMNQETQELVADKARMNRVLSALDLDPVQGLPPKLRKFVKTLSKAMDALDAANSSLPMLVVAVTEMQDKINKSSVDIELLEERCRVLREDCNEVKDLYALLERQFTELECQLPNEQKNVESLQKSERFHHQKRKQYDGAITEGERILRASNFHPGLFHDEVSKMGRKASELNEKLQPLLLQLESYNRLPADADLARLKLCEVVDELKQVESELHEALHNVSLSK